MKTLYAQKTLIFSILLIFIVISNKGFSQPAVAWHSCFGGTYDDNVYCIKQTLDSGYIAAGETSSTDGQVTGYNGGTDGWIVKMDKYGVLQWQKCVGGTSVDKIYNIQQTKDSGYIAVGYSNSNDSLVHGNHGSADMFAVKLNSSGNIIWQKCYGGSGFEGAQSVQQTFDNGYILAGSSYSVDGDVTGNHGTSGDGWVVKTDAYGNLQWQKCLGGSVTDVINSVQQTPDSGFILCGQANSHDGDVSNNHATSNAWAVRLNKSGTLLWNNCYCNTPGGIFQSVIVTEDSSYVFVGGQLPITGYAFNYDLIIIKTDTSGIIKWQKYFGGDSLDKAMSVYQTSDGGYIIGGETQSKNGDVTGNHGESDAWVIRLDSFGNLMWQKCLGGSHQEASNSIMQTYDGGYISAGCSASSDDDAVGNHGEWDFLVIKLETDAAVNPVKIDKLLQIYPNPTSGIVNIETPNQENMNIDIYTITGIQVFHNSIHANTEINLSQLASGIYILKVSGVDWTGVRKIVKE